jgi:integrase
VARFLAAKKKENLADSTIDKLTSIFEKQLLTWARGEGIQNLEEIGPEELERLRETWTDAPLARKKKQERVIGFFYYCQRMGWIAINPAILLGRIKVQEKPTDYFPTEEFEKIIQATYIYNPKAWNTEPRNMATRVRILIWLMRWSGLRIKDAVGLQRSSLNDNDELFLYQAKTKHPVYVPLPPDVAAALRNIPPGPKPNPRYFFWSGNGKLKSAVSDWQRALRRVFDIADIRHPDGNKKRCHPQMFRDTFAVESLLAGVLLEQVSILLGHKSIKITEKHYAPWVKARQLQLTSSVRRSWPAASKPERRARRKEGRDSVSRERLTGDQNLAIAREPGKFEQCSI